MIRLYSFFVCAFVLAGCSPRYFSGEQSARTFQHEESVDSASFKSLVDRLVHEELQKQLEIRELLEQTSVKETLSVPDSTGAQFVMERTTTTLSKKSKTSAGSTHTKDEDYHEKVDSTAKKSSDISFIEEEQKKITGEVKGWCPWYIYVAALVGAIVLGFMLYRHGKKWFHLTSK